MASGFGRGGRGAALLKLLEQTPRLPGEQVTPTATPTNDTPQQAPPTSYIHPPTTKHVGRGFAKLRASSTETTPTPQPPKLGRGFTPSVPKGRGRAAALRDSPPQQRPPPQPSPPSASSQAPPTSFLARMSLRDAPAPVDKSGSSGDRLDLVANYIRLEGKTGGIYQHTVTFDPPEDSKHMRYKLMSSPEVTAVIGKTRAFDGVILFLPHHITDSSVSVAVKRPTDGSVATVTIMYTCMVQYANCVQLFNVIFRRILRHLEMKQVGRYYYDPHNPIAIPQHKMELWPGYISAIQQYDGGLMLMFDVSHRLMRTDSALDFLYELYHKNKSNFQDMALKQLVGCVVLTRYNNRTYRVDDIAWDKNPMSTFMDHTGKSVSFVDYYKRAYDKTIMDKEQPLLLHRPKRRDKLNKDAPEEVICLVPELCCMTGLTDYARSDFRVMKDIATHTRVTPSAREKAFRSFVQRMKATPKAVEELEGWGLSLESGLTELSGSQAGRHLPMEKVLFRKKTVLAGDDADWSRDAVKEQQIVAVPLRQWVVVVTKRDRAKAAEFVNMMKRVAPPMGIEVQDARIVEVPNDRTDTYLHAIRSQICPELQLVVIVFPTSRDDRYAAVKKLCCIEKPIPSQVINARTISAQQKLRSVSQKIALQINCKLGGELWALNIPVKNLMIVGVDVYHDSVLGKSRSITGFVSSTNPHMTRWYSRVAIQGPQQELVDGLKLCFRAALQKFHQENGGLPERIIVYRDGVGDGMMHTVAQYEVPQMTSCFADLFGEAYQPKMAVVVVQKRISTRIFCRSPRTGLENPPPGTVVDHTITRRGIYDFFLVSQKVRQGTVTPTHYTVVHDSSTLKPDHMQRLAYKMTHMYYNWPGTIRVPAPCQYAHKLAFLVGQSLHKDPALELADRLFFL